MIEKTLDRITYADIERFVQEKWPEGKSVDYKRDNYGGKDDDKKELLKDVSSFANTQGGDIIIGVDEDKGAPIGIPGIVSDNIDKEKLRLEGIIRQGLEPRVESSIHSTPTPAGTFVVIIRVKESLLSPHRVMFQGKSGEFWARSSAGKYSMDTDQLRRAFTLSESIYDRIRSFRKSRVDQIVEGETPIPLASGGIFIMHLIPTSAFRSRQIFEQSAVFNIVRRLSPLASASFQHRLNLDGILSYAGREGREGYRTYTQYFRNGIVEVVLTGIVELTSVNGESQKVLQTYRYENDIVSEEGFFKNLWNALREMELQPPIWCFLTLAGVKGAKIQPPNAHIYEHHSIDRSVLSLPEQIIDDLSAPPDSAMNPLIELIWNAAGLERSKVLMLRT